MTQIRKALPLLQRVASGRPCDGKLLRAMRQLSKSQAGPKEPEPALKREASATSAHASDDGNVGPC